MKRSQVQFCNENDVTKRETFFEKYGQFIGNNVCDSEPVNAGDLKRYMMKNKSGGWDAREMAQFTDAIWDRLADFLNVVEKVGRWPRALTTSFLFLSRNQDQLRPQWS